MARTDPQLNTRIPVELKARIEESAQESKRSLNAEVIALLESALKAKEYPMFDGSAIRVLTETIQSLESRVGELSKEVAKNKRQ